MLSFKDYVYTVPRTISLPQFVRFCSFTCDMELCTVWELCKKKEVIYICTQACRKIFEKVQICPAQCM